MKIEISKTIYDGKKFIDLGFYSSLESAHYEHKNYVYQQTFEDIENGLIPYIHLMEFRNDEHYNDLYFTNKNI
jgi:hypothetical protein